MIGKKKPPGQRFYWEGEEHSRAACIEALNRHSCIFFEYDFDIIKLFLFLGMQTFTLHVFFDGDVHHK